MGVVRLQTVGDRRGPRRAPRWKPLSAMAPAAVVGAIHPIGSRALAGRWTSQLPICSKGREGQLLIAAPGSASPDGHMVFTAQAAGRAEAEGRLIAADALGHGHQNPGHLLGLAAERGGEDVARHTQAARAVCAARLRAVRSLPSTWWGRKSRGRLGVSGIRPATPCSTT